MDHGQRRVGTDCAGADCADVVWGTQLDDSLQEADNIVWGTMAEADNVRGLAFYEPAGLRLELAVMRRLLAAPGEVCHVLYGEDHFNHLARMRHVRGRRSACHGSG